VTVVVVLLVLAVIAGGGFAFVTKRANQRDKQAEEDRAESIRKACTSGTADPQFPRYRRGNPNSVGSIDVEDWKGEHASRLLFWLAGPRQEQYPTGGLAKVEIALCVAPVRILTSQQCDYSRYGGNLQEGVENTLTVTTKGEFEVRMVEIRTGKTVHRETFVRSQGCPTGIELGPDGTYDQSVELEPGKNNEYLLFAHAFHNGR
jgi:hypothetical protein